MKKIIMDDSYGENIREPRFYEQYGPTLRSGGGRFKVIEIELEDVETDTNNWKQTSQCLYR